MGCQIAQKATPPKYATNKKTTDKWETLETNCKYLFTQGSSVNINVIKL